jgi:putative ABC transport system ATP-binding protein
VRLDHVGFIFQGFNLFPTLTAGENVELALDLKGIRGKVASRRAGELLEQVGLSDRYNTFPSDLSGGQKQRVAIARALAGEPDIILADEPTAALDSHSGRVVIQMLRNLAHQHGRAVAIVTHDNRMLDFGDRIVHIEDGRIQEKSIVESQDQSSPQTWGLEDAHEKREHDRCRIDGWHGVGRDTFFNES